MDDDAKRTMENSMEDAISILRDVTRKYEREFGEDSIVKVAMGIYKERMGRKNSKWMQEQMEANAPKPPSDRGRY